MAQIDTLTSKIEHALRLAELGFHILPCQPRSKNPKKGYRWGAGATTDPNQIKQWFEDDPDMNYGVCPRDKGVIIDLDVKPEAGIDGRDTWANVLLEHDDLVETLTVRSPSGGLHLYFSTDVEVGNAHNFGKDSGIDVRGTGGYVVGPGCELQYGAYEVTEARPTARAPDWLVHEYLRQPGSKSDLSHIPLLPMDLRENIAKAEDFLSTCLPAIEGMNGNDHTYETAEWIRDFGVSEEKCIELMQTTGWNDRCQPPWSPQELEAVVRNAYRYGQNRPGEKADLLSMFENSMTVEEFEALMMPCDISTPGPTFKPRERRLNFYRANEFMGRGIRREYIIPGWLPAHGFTAINARRGVGKSAIMLDLACRIASDMDWGDEPIMGGYTAIYFCGEDDEGLELNMAAWQMHHDREIPPDRLIVADDVANLMSRDDVESCLTKVQELTGTDRKCVVFLDTWQRATMAAGQNKDEDMQLCIRHAEQLAHYLRGPLVGAFHPPKDNRQTILGSSVIENSSTAIWQVSDDGRDRIKVEVTRIKGSGRYNWRNLEFKFFPMDEKDQFGNPQIGMVALPDGPTMHDDEAAAEESKRQVFAELIRALFLEDGQQPEEERKPWTVNAVAKAITGKTAVIAGGEKTLPAVSTLNAELPRLFRTPFRFHEENVSLVLHDTGEKKGGGTVREFRLQATGNGSLTTDADPDGSPASPAHSRDYSESPVTV